MKAILTVFLLLLFNVAIARSFTDTLTAAEKNALTTAYRNSCFGQLMLVDSCSKSGDSIAAGYFLMRVNPYYIYSDNQTPQTLDSYLVRHYLIPSDIRKKYLDSFTKVFNKPRTKAYISFENMFREDQMLRQILDTSTADSTSNSLTSKRMQYTDSVHFVYLLKYIHKYGWPSIENGSIFASVIALHDHYHHKKYFEIIKKATLTGIVDKQVLELFITWMSTDKSLQAELSKYHYQRFDISELLVYNMPASLKLIKNAVAEHCPVRWIFSMEMGKDRTIEKDRYETQYGDFRKCITKLQREIVNNNCHCPTATLHGIELGLWSYSWMRVANDATHFFIYIFYGDEIKYNDLDILFADSSFATHAIYFENNKAEIQAESYVFLNELVQWLKSKPGIKIEILGHTDNVGKPQDNIKLSQERAYSVRNYLMAEGVDASRLTAKGYGATKPLEPNYTDEGKAINRRVELRKVE